MPPLDRFRRLDVRGLLAQGQEPLPVIRRRLANLAPCAAMLLATACGARTSLGASGEGGDGGGLGSAASTNGGTSTGGVRLCSRPTPQPASCPDGSETLVSGVSWFRSIAVPDVMVRFNSKERLLPRKI